MDDSHYLTNIVPQDLDNNSGYSRIIVLVCMHARGLVGLYQTNNRATVIISPRSHAFQEAWERG